MPRNLSHASHYVTLSFTIGGGITKRLLKRPNSDHVLVTVAQNNSTIQYIHDERRGQGEKPQRNPGTEIFIKGKAPLKLLVFSGPY